MATLFIYPLKHANMALYWKIFDQAGQIVDKKIVDEQLCAHFNEPVHKRNYYMMWPDSIVYPFLYSDAADGTWNAVKLWYDEDVLDRATYDLHILPVVDWFKMMKYTPKRATAYEYNHPIDEVALEHRQLIEN